MRGPDFFIVGAPRCATTSLHDYLDQHPEISIPGKDLYFFGRDLISRPLPSMRACRDKVEYLSHFHDRNENLLGERDVWYLYSKSAAQEIKQMFPSAKIFIMLRNPIEMLLSLHAYFLAGGHEDIRDFEKAVATENDRKHGLKIPSTLGFPNQFLFYREVAHFSEQIERYFYAFGRQNVKVIIFNDFIEHTAVIYKNCLGFLGVDDSFRAHFRVLNPRKTTVHPKVYFKKSWESVHRVRDIIPSSVVKYLKTYFDSLGKRFAQSITVINTSVPSHMIQEFTEEIERLSNLLGRDLTHWCQMH